MSFLLRVTGLSLRDKVRRSVIWEGLGVLLAEGHADHEEDMLERLSLSWLGNALGMHPSG